LAGVAGALILRIAATTRLTVTVLTGGIAARLRVAGCNSRRWTRQTIAEREELIEAGIERGRALSIARVMEARRAPPPGAETRNSSGLNHRVRAMAFQSRLAYRYGPSRPPML
jgi:hypothetical protein